MQMTPLDRLLCVPRSLLAALGDVSAAGAASGDTMLLDVACRHGELRELLLVVPEERQKVECLLCRQAEADLLVVLDDVDATSRRVDAHSCTGGERARGVGLDRLVHAVHIL